MPPLFRILAWALLAVTGFLIGCSDGRSLSPEAATTTITSPAPEAAPSPVRIMPLGDSITQSDSQHDSYRRPLWHALSAIRPVDFVGSLSTNHRGAPPNADFDLDHEGHWGFRVDEILERLPGWIAEHRPEVVLVHLGSNDLFQRQPVDETVREVAALIEIVRAEVPTATILLAKIIPTTTPAVNARITAFNARLPIFASGAVRIVDHPTGFDPQAMTHDGVHPNASGEGHMAERWLDALAEVLP